LRRFTYHEPKSIADAVHLLSAYGEKARLIAGGTDLVVEMKQGKKEPDHVISLRSVPGVNEINFSGGYLRLGAMVTHRAIERSPLIRERFTLLADAVDNLGSVQVRNVATVGGNICNGAPSADTAGPLLALDAVLLVEGPEGERNISLNEFFRGPGKTALAANEVLKQIIIPELPPEACSRYLKHTRRKAMDLPLLGVAVTLIPEAGGEICREARIALTLAAPTPIRAIRAEKHVAGKPFYRAVWEEAGVLALEDSSPRTSFRTTAAYRKKMICALLPRAAAEALERSGRTMKG
jgi:carbon-monoxide dehydrogenase medium subunit